MRWVIEDPAVIYSESVLPMFSSKSFIVSVAVQKLLSLIRSPTHEKMLNITHY